MTGSAVVLLVGASVLVTTLNSDFRLLARPIPTLEALSQRVLAPPILSEYRIGDAVERLRALGADEEIHVITDQSFGMPSDGLAVGLWGRDEVRLFFAWWINESSIPLAPEAAVQVFESNHHRTTAKITLRRGELRSRTVYWLVNSLRYPAEFVTERSPGAEQVFSLPSPDGATLDLYRIAGP